MEKFKAWTIYMYTSSFFSSHMLTMGQHHDNLHRTGPLCRGL